MLHKKKIVHTFYFKNKKIDFLKRTMESTVKELQKEVNKYKKMNENLNGFLKENDFKDEKSLIFFIKEAKNHKCTSNNEIDIKDSDHIKELKNIKHELNILNFDYLSIKRGIFRYKKIKQKSDVLIKEIKEYNIYDTYNKISSVLSLLEKDFDEWCKIPKCTECECVFDNKNIQFNVQKYELYQLCRNCIGDKLKNIVKKKSIIKKVDEIHKDSIFINKLCSKNYVYIKFYNELYINNQKEKHDLYDPEIISKAGFNPENPYDKYKLNNLCYRSNKLIELFDDKIQFFDITEQELSRIGKIEFQAICDVLYEQLDGYSGMENIIEALNMNNEPPSDIESDNEDDYIPDPDYESDNDTMRFGSSLLQNKRLTKVIF